MTERPEPTVGMPATIMLYSDARPAVVVKINPKSIVVQDIEHDETKGHVRNPGEPYPAVEYPPKLDANGNFIAIPGSEVRFTRTDTGDGPIFRRGSYGLKLGRAYRFIDWRI